MTQRDERWEQVYATIGEVPLAASDIETGYAEVLKKWQEIRIDVWHDGQHVWLTQQIHKEDLGEDLQTIGWLLNEMVRKIDERLDTLHGGVA